MHLTNKELALLTSPFILSGALWGLNTYYINSLSLFFDPQKPPYNAIVEEKGELYRSIEQDKANYIALMKKTKIRDENRFWIAERLYLPVLRPISEPLSTSATLSLLPPPPLIPFSEGNISGPTQSWSIQMVLPEQNMAIINNRIIRVNQRIDGVQLLEVKHDRVFIKTTKGKQWVKLFH